MASLHDALHCLKPTTWGTVPQSPDELRDYVCDIFKKSRLVAESLPDPPPYEDGIQNNSESTIPRVIPSSARVGETDPEIKSIQKEWGKPIKMGGHKDNPLGVHVWKLSANDGGGSWFGRRSVHEGMSFSRWREKISSEYDETLKVNRMKIEKGQTPDKSIRGIGAEEKIETVEVKGEDGSVMAEITIYHVSAQFPKPTAPRDFVTMIITSSTGLQIGGSKQPGQSWLMISKPCDHPDVPLKPGYTRGEYESVELIREVPRKANSDSSSSTSIASDGKKREVGEKSEKPLNGEDQGQADQEKNEEPNPVEWIMVTRSDPGGSIPRWMVDKGTPRSVGADAAKFVDWAIQEDKPKKQGRVSRDDYNQEGDTTEPKSGESTSQSKCDGNEQESDSDSELTDSDAVSHHGLIASVTGLISSSIERYAPRSVYGYAHESTRSVPGSFDIPEVTVDGADADSYKSSGTKDLQDAQSTSQKEPEQASLASTRSEAATPMVDEVVQNNLSPTELMEMTKNGKLSSNEKELAKLALRKRDVESKLEKIRSELDNLHLAPRSLSATPTKGLNHDMDSDKSGMLKQAAENRAATPTSDLAKQSQESSSSGDQGTSQTVTPTPELPAHMHKAASQLLNEEAKLLKQLRKIEASQLKVASKIETRRRKEAERSEKSKSRSEVDGLRQEVKDLKKEVSKLRAERQKWVDLVASLQAENTKLAAAEKKKEESS